MKKDCKILVTKNGPFMVSGNLPLAKEIAVVGSDGNPTKWKRGEKYTEKDNYALCRCGKSCNKPFCDGTHIKINFDGTETASKKKYIEKADKISGPDLDLTDSQDLCSATRFCHRSGGTWNLTKNSDNPKSKEIAIQEACDCPSGRLVCWDKKTGKPTEPKFEPSIGLIEDPGANVSGPLWVKGRIPIESADGSRYEIRNRVTLCRCGESRNKPFCDGCHIEAEFRDDDNNDKGRSKKNKSC